MIYGSFNLQLFSVSAKIGYLKSFGLFCGEMAESRGSLIAKSVQKHAGRAKEKVSDFTEEESFF